MSSQFSRYNHVNADKTKYMVMSREQTAGLGHTMEADNSSMEEGRGVHKVLVGKPEGMRPLGRPRRRWEDNIKMHLHDVGSGCGDWMELAQNRDRWRALVSTVMNIRLP
jgi:hypothetical protein